MPEHILHNAGVHALGRLLGDLSPIMSGNPKKIGKRAVLRAVGKATGKALGRILK